MASDDMLRTRDMSYITRMYTDVKLIKAGF